jgi:hypothetical protein
MRENTTGNPRSYTRQETATTHKNANENIGKQWKSDFSATTILLTRDS